MSLFRENLWFLSSFFKKYSRLIFGSLILTVFAVVLIKQFSQFLPKPKSQYRVGIVGQFGANQLPPRIINFLNSGLVSLNEKQEPQPNLAQNWEISEDGKVYTFYLRPELKWSTNEPLFASQINMSIPNINIETQDPNIIRFKIPTKYAPFLNLLTVPLLNSQSKLAGDYEINLKQKGSGVITQITLESSTKKIIFNVYSTPKQALVAFKLGQVDMVIDLPTDYLEGNNSYGKVKKEVDLNHVVMLIFNQTDPNLKDKNIRQGIAYALQNKTFGEHEALTTIHPNSWGYNPLVKTYPFNPERAKELIKNKISLELATTPELLGLAEKIKSQLDSNIIEINTKVVTSTPDQFQLYLTSYAIPSDPDQYRDWHSTQSNNIGRGSDEKIDKLLEDGRTSQDQKTRKGVYFDFQKSFSEELPALTLFHPSIFHLSRHQEFFDLIK